MGLTWKIITSLIITTNYNHNVALAWPTMAGSCNSPRAVGSTHIGDSTGSLALAGYEVLVNDQSMNTTETNSLAANVSHTVTLHTDGSGREDFKGFLIRLSGANGEDVSGSLVMLEGDGDVQLLKSCPGDVAGYCHTYHDSKTSVSVLLSHPCEVPKLTLEVTVVAGNKGLDSDGWYYSPYDVTIVSSDASNCTVVGDASVNGDTDTMTGMSSDMSPDDSPSDDSPSGIFHISKTSLMIVGMLCLVQVI